MRDFIGGNIVKKIITVVLVVAMITAMSIMPSFAAVVHSSRDQITTHDPAANQYVHKSETDLGLHGQNLEVTELGDISSEKLGLLVVYGWSVSEYKIKSFGYESSTGTKVTNVPKFINQDPDRQSDNETIAGQAETAFSLPDGESVRFRYEIPVEVGEDIEIRLFLIDENDDECDLNWTIIYSNDYQPTAEESTPDVDMGTLTAGGDDNNNPPADDNNNPPADDNNPPADDNNTPGNTDTADSFSIIVMVAVAVAAASVLLKKRVNG